MKNDDSNKSKTSILYWPRQAIITRYMAPTNYHQARMKAQAARGSITITYDDALSIEGNHRNAAQYLKQKFCTEDLEQYGSPKATNPWAAETTMGVMPKGTYCHVYQEYLAK